MNNQINLLLLSAVLLGGGSEVAAESVRLYGTLVSDPCIVKSEEIEVDFGTIVDKYLYTNTRTLGQIFTIELEDCDLSLGNTVKVTFIGPESLELPGLLTVSNQNKGIAIGIETLQAKKVLFNQSSDILDLQAINSQLVFKAYVQGEPTAIANKTIERGVFSATSTFMLAYP